MSDQRTSAIIVILLVCVLQVFATEKLDPSLDPLYKLIQTLRSYPSFILRFEQETHNLTSNQSVKANGRLTFALPDRFRWDYFSSPPNVIACDGTTLMMLLPEDKQVMVEPASENQIIWSPITLLTDPGRLTAEFDVTSLSANSLQIDSFKLVPHEKKSFDYLIVEIPKSPADFLFRFQIFDLAGNRNSVQFSALTSSPSMVDFLPKVPSDYETTDFSGKPVAFDRGQAENWIFEERL